MIEYRSLNELVHEEIKKRIMDNSLQPKQKLEIDKLSEELNVSRTPVINALKTLHQDGFVTIHPRSGTYVRQYTLEEVDAFMDFRGAIENIVVKQAIKVADPATLQHHIAVLQKNLYIANAGLFDETDLKQYYDNQYAFHQYLWSFSPELIQNTVRNLVELVQRFYLQHLYYSLCEKSSERFMQAEIENHIRLAEALLEKDLEKALYYMEKDICETKQDVVAKHFDEIDGYQR